MFSICARACGPHVQQLSEGSHYWRKASVWALVSWHLISWRCSIAMTCQSTQSSLFP